MITGEREIEIMAKIVPIDSLNAALSLLQDESIHTRHTVLATSSEILSQVIVGICKSDVYAVTFITADNRQYSVENEDAWEDLVALDENGAHRIYIYI